MSSGTICHVFVLMLENRAFDHMLGFSQIAGKDAASGQPTKIDGLSGAEFNEFNGKSFTVSPNADRIMPCDPDHEFDKVLEQLCGQGASYKPGGTYPQIVNSGFVSSYVSSGGGADPAEIMKCFQTQQLPVITTLAKEFAICDRWYASLPGPTWPNRMFVHAASSSGLDHSPKNEEIGKWELIEGFSFKNGTIFDALGSKGMIHCLYAGDDFPMITALKGVGLRDIRDFDDFNKDLAQNPYPYSYVFIEPSYHVLNQYRNSTSQHPLTDVALGEALIKSTYESIRNSPIWNNSVLIITWDEHGGFYDHGIPPVAVAPGDTMPGSKFNQYGFTFEQYGPRVPAVVISPLIPKNVVDHRTYDHSSIPATIEKLFGLTPLTARDAAANSLHTLFTLTAPRADCPTTLPSLEGNLMLATSVTLRSSDLSTTQVARPNDSVNEGNLPLVLHSAMRQDIQINPAKRELIQQRVAKIKTREQAREYLAEVQQNVRRNRSSSALGHSAPH